MENSPADRRTPPAPADPAPSELWQMRHGGGHLWVFSPRETVSRAVQAAECLKGPAKPDVLDEALLEQLCPAVAVHVGHMQVSQRLSAIRWGVDVLRRVGGGLWLPGVQRPDGLLVDSVVGAHRVLLRAKPADIAAELLGHRLRDVQRGQHRLFALDFCVKPMST